MYVCVTKLIPNGFVGKIVKCKLFLRLKKNKHVFKSQEIIRICMIHL